MTYDENIDWENLVMKEAIGFNNSDLGQVQEVRGDNIITKTGGMDEEVYAIPRNLVEKFDGHRLLLRVTKEEAETLYKIKESYMNKQKDHKNDIASKDSDDGNVTSSSISSPTYEKSVKLGEFIGNALTSNWNSQKKPGKVYVKNRRIHHGEVGTSMGIADAFKDLSPAITGIISGIGKGLVKDDIADKHKWFTFKKKEEEEEDKT